MREYSVNKMKRELAAIIINELTRQASKRRVDMRDWVRKEYLHIGGPLNMELRPYFDDESPYSREHEDLQNADLEVLVGIANKLGFDIEVTWTRRRMP